MAVHEPGETTMQPQHPARVEIEQKDRTKSFEINGPPYGVEPLLCKLKSRTKSNDINVRFDSSCNVLVIEDQFLGGESKCDFGPRAEQIASAHYRSFIGWCRSPTHGVA
jgi:hypothetical protein